MFEICEISAEDPYSWFISMVRFTVCDKMDSFREGSFSVCSK